ncbi:type IA DNA topoisomerase [Alteribacter natronophilus]|uniref:type IA DNA topoisomerase n=1 Tax=Alteribacter natronophilus TaxID=2583810 RepID=UPI00110E9DF8|nr:type IA DNA topoisomerase [Alteribacter natronophilus]TMW72878.1 DNA topoisomerase III [Alteribacter natronophilus]
MPVILAEKPSQAKAYADAFSRVKKEDGFFSISPCATFPGGAILTWGIGHLVELKDPHEYAGEWKRWSLDKLPIIPDRFEFKPSARTRKQFAIVKKLLRNADEIIVATDCDREGENIARSIIDQAGANRKPTRRLWINSLEADEVRKGFENLKPGESYLPLYAEAQARQVSDWVVGINASRLYTLLIQKKGARDVFSVGRVQTPTLKLIRDREIEIENFKPEKFYEIEGHFKTEAGSYKGKAKGRFKTKDEVRELLKKHQVPLDGTGMVKKVADQLKRQKPPKLHSLSTLQTAMNKKYKYSPSKTLKIVQSLYDQPLKLVTYPRTDTQHITENEFKYLRSNLDGYKRLAGADFEPASLAPNRRYVDGGKVQEHHAIVPTKKVPAAGTIQGLRTDQRNVYMEIVNSTLAMFHRDYTYLETTITTAVSTLDFFTKGRVEKDRGWKELFFKRSQEKDEVLPPVKEGMEAAAKVTGREDETKPPKPYTAGQLINMMKTCGQIIDDDDEAKKTLKEVEGLGTEATRSSIIDTLIKQNYITVTKNIVTVTEKGKLLCEAVEGTLLSKPLMTAKWEKYLKTIGQGAGKKEAFIENTVAFTRKVVADAGQAVDKLTVNAEVTGSGGKSRGGGAIARCPACKKGLIMDKYRVYGCSEYKAGCKQIFPKKILGKPLSEATIKALCEKGKTRKLKGFQGKKKFDAALELKDGEIKFAFAAKT